MVKVAIAGGTGGLGREVIDALLAKDKHQIIVLTRQVNGSTHSSSPFFRP